MPQTMTPYEYRQTFRIDLSKEFKLDIGVPPTHKLGYHALDYDNLGAPPAESDDDGGDDADEAAAGVAALASGRHAELVRGCGYQVNDGFVDDEEQRGAALQALLSARVKTVRGGFHVNRGNIETQDLPGRGLQDVLRAASRAPGSPSSGARGVAGLDGLLAEHLTDDAINELIAELGKKAHALQAQRRLAREHPAELKKIPQSLDNLLVSVACAFVGVLVWLMCACVRAWRIASFAAEGVRRGPLVLLCSAVLLLQLWNLLLLCCAANMMCRSSSWTPAPKWTRRGRSGRGRRASSPPCTKRCPRSGRRTPWCVRAYVCVCAFVQVGVWQRCAGAT
jgi:hypothetical protein